MIVGQLGEFSTTTEAALRAFEAGRARDPQAGLFTETQLNRVGYAVLRNGRVADAVAAFRKVLELYPRSSNAHDSLAEALEARGEHAEAVAVSRRGLAALAGENLPPAQREQLQQILQQRVRRLGG